MHAQNIQITQADHIKLQNLLQDKSALQPADKACHAALLQELMRAQILPSEAVSPDVITLHSRARLLDLRTNEMLELTIVLPDELNLESGHISILAPLGTAMLGYRKGDVFEWDTPGGPSRFRVEDVLFQPEATARAD